MFFVTIVLSEAFFFSKNTVIALNISLCGTTSRHSKFGVDSAKFDSMFSLSLYSLLNCWINKTIEWMKLNYLLTTIQNALYQSSEQGASLLFTCPMLTAVS